MKSKMGLLLGTVACLAAFGAGCASDNSAPQPTPYAPPAEQTAPATSTSAATSTMDNTGPIKIGFIGPLTGDASSLGTVSQAAVQIAEDEINAAGGINGRPLQVVYEDGKCNATAGTDAANKLMNVDHVVAIDGGLCSSETAAFGPTAMQNNTVVVSYCSSAPTPSSALTSPAYVWKLSLTLLTWSNASSVLSTCKGLPP